MEYTHPLNLHYTLKGQQVYTIINVCVFSKTIQMKNSNPLNLHYCLRGQQAYSIKNFCVFMNTIQ